MVSFYAPVRYQGEIIGVLRGSYLAEEYLKDMLTTSYFGEAADVYLCMENGRAIASSEGDIYEEDLIDKLVETNVIDAQAAREAKGSLCTAARARLSASRAIRPTISVRHTSWIMILFWFRPFQRA